MVLSFVRGHTENCELCRELLGRLVKRGFVPLTEYLLAVLDGGNALSKAGLEFFPTAKAQRGFVHKERNLHAYLSKNDHGECSGVVDRVPAQGAEDCEARSKELERYLVARNQSSVLSLHVTGPSC